MWSWPIFSQKVPNMIAWGQKCKIGHSFKVSLARIEKLQLDVVFKSRPQILKYSLILILFTLKRS
jgi:hypothetical protein